MSDVYSQEELAAADRLLSQMTDAQKSALRRFHETTADDQSYDISHQD